MNPPRDTSLIRAFSGESVALTFVLTQTLAGDGDQPRQALDAVPGYHLPGGGSSRAERKAGKEETGLTVLHRPWAQGVANLSLRECSQAMVFVHSRKDTARTARSLSEEAQRKGEYDVFASVDDSAMDISLLQREVSSGCGCWAGLREASFCRRSAGFDSVCFLDTNATAAPIHRPGAEEPECRVARAGTGWLRLPPRWHAPL